MNYTPPLLNLLLSTAQNLSVLCQTETERKLAKLLETTASIVTAQLPSANAAKQKELHESLLGTYLYVLEGLRNEYNYSLYSVENTPLYAHLNILGSITAREKLIYTNKLHQFVELNKESLDQTQNLKSDQLLASIEDALVAQLTELTNPITKIVNAVPTELSITNHMEKLPSSYIEAIDLANKKAWFFTSKANPKRIFLTQLAEAISKVRCEDDNNLPEGSFTRSQRIKIGALLYIEKKIAKEYYLRSPKNSALYRECRKILNINSEYNLDDAQQLSCLDSFNSHINDSKEKSSIEEYGRTQFAQNNLLIDMDTRLASISTAVTAMRSALESSFTKNWPATVTGATLGAILFSAPGYGFGTVYGISVSEGSAVRPITDTIGHGIKAYFGNSSAAGRYSYLISDLFIASTLTRAFAKIFEAIGMAAGGIAGGAIGFTVDLTYKGLHEVCIRYLDFYDHHPDQMRNADPELVRCLLELPPEIFTPDKQNQIRYTKGIDDQQPAVVMNR